MSSSPFRAMLRFRISLLVLAFVAAQTLWAADPPAPFVYQGHLKEKGVAANGTYDLAFVAYDAITDGARISEFSYADDTPVVDGVFSVQIDFCSGVLYGGDMYVEIMVRPGATDNSNHDVSTYVILSPRQPFLPSHTSYVARDALKLEGLNSAALRNASNINAGTLNTARYSSYTDLTDEGKVGSGADQVAAGEHTHTTLEITDLAPISTTPAANTIPMADATGKLASDWLPYSPSSGPSTMVRMYQNNSGGALVAGTPVVFAADSLWEASFQAPVVGTTDFGPSDEFELVPVDESRALFFYRDTGDSNRGKVCVVTVDGSSVIFGTPVTFSTNAVEQIHAGAAVWNSSYCLCPIAYKDVVASGALFTLAVRMLSSGELSIGPASMVSSEDVSAFDLVSRRFPIHLIAFADPADSGKGKLVSCTINISTMTITQNAGIDFCSSATDFVALAAASASQMLILFNDSSDGGKGRFASLDVVRNDISTLSLGSESPVYAPVGQADMFEFDSGHFIAGWSPRGGISDYVDHIAHLGDRLNFFNYGTHVGLGAYAPISSGKFIRAYARSTSGMEVTCCLTDGADVVLDAPMVNYFATVTDSDLDVGVLGASTVLLVHAVAGMAKFTLGQIGQPIGIVNTTILNGASGEVIVSGVASNQSGLVPGATYYLTKYGDLSRTSGWAKLGRAMSATDLLLDIE
ncbi:hypothetical protein KQI84_07950 [bacterium]|nr:hypothetical protein [bacterium]